MMYLLTYTLQGGTHICKIRKIHLGYISIHHTRIWVQKYTGRKMYLSSDLKYLLSLLCSQYSGIDRPALKIEIGMQH